MFLKQQLKGKIKSKIVIIKIRKIIVILFFCHIVQLYLLLCIIVKSSFICSELAWYSYFTIILMQYKLNQKKKQTQAHLTIWIERKNWVEWIIIIK